MARKYFPDNELVKRRRPAVVCILDGWGNAPDSAENAISLGHTPNWDRFIKDYPNSTLNASGEEVGLPAGQMGNSEVGHMNLGAGRVVLQDLPRIDEAIATGKLTSNKVLLNFIDSLKKSGGVCHLMGLLSPGGVHSQQDHIVQLARIIGGAGVPVALHAFLDGRDTPPKSAKKYMAHFIAATATIPGFFIATISGRYYAMDRDKRWNRVQKACLALSAAEGETAADPVAAIVNSYNAGLNDEFMLPCVIRGYEGMNDGDGLLHANFRSDRTRELLYALVAESFTGFARPRPCKFAARAGMCRYSRVLDEFFDSLFPAHNLPNVIGKVIADAGLTQLRIAETEKYAHVTFFFNGGREEEFPGEERIMLPSPKVATYDLQPAMSAVEITDKLVKAIDSGRFDLIIVNYANGDMVGHSGFLDAAVKAVQTVDTCLGRLESAVKDAGGVMLLTADHGNCEQMLDHNNQQPHTAHTLNRVPVILVNGPDGKLRQGRLADVAPTILDLMKLAKPDDMTGETLFAEKCQ